MEILSLIKTFPGTHYFLRKGAGSDKRSGTGAAGCQSQGRQRVETTNYETIAGAKKKRIRGKFIRKWFTGKIKSPEGFRPPGFFWLIESFLIRNLICGGIRGFVIECWIIGMDSVGDVVYGNDKRTSGFDFPGFKGHGAIGRGNA